jgi:RNA polymerase sigma-70 factor (ECF subfamily)
MTDDDTESPQAATVSGPRGLLRRNLAASGAFDGPSAPVNTERDSDVQLMLAVQRGDMAAFQRLFERHSAAVVGFATQFVGSRARAEELAQDVFLQVYRTRTRYVPRARFTTWLYRMATNACLSEVRRKDHRTQSIDRPPARGGDEPGWPIEVPTRSAEDVMLGREALNRMRAALADLPPQQRAALLLARVEGFAYEEVAASLSRSVSAVKSLIHRATVTLRERLREDRG